MKHKTNTLAASLIWKPMPSARSHDETTCTQNDNSKHVNETQVSAPVLECDQKPSLSQNGTQALPEVFLTLLWPKPLA